MCTVNIIMQNVKMRPLFGKPVMTELLKSWRRRVSSSVKDPEMHDRLTNSKPLLYRKQPHPALNRMIRVNQAGERAAVMICAGQIAVLGKSALGEVVK
jgi:demethoxyubiquinone hydroxylase (CLK1/Coq7/Cat5 family)